MRLREFQERQRLDENPGLLLPIILGALGLTAGASLQNQIDPKKVEKWVSQNTKEAGEFVDSLQKNYGPDVKKPETITNPIGNAITQSWNWLTGGSTQKDNVKKPYVPQPENYTTNKDGLLVNKNKKSIAPKVQYDQYISKYNTNQDGKFRGKIPPQLIGNIRSQGDAGKNWVKQYDELYKKRSQINKKIAADIKNGLTQQQLDQKYGDNLKNLNRNLNDHLGKVDDFSKGLKPLQQRNIKTYKTMPLKPDQQGQISKSIGSVGGVSGQKGKQGTAGATIGGGGMDIGIKGSGAVSGGKTDATGKAKEQPGAITGPELDVKGQSIGTTGTQQGATTGAQQGATTGAQQGVTTSSGSIAKVVPNIQKDVLTRTVMPPPPPPMPPNVKGYKYEKPKGADGDYIFLGRDRGPPKGVIKQRMAKQQDFSKRSKDYEV